MTLKKNSFHTLTIDSLLPFGSGQGLLEGTPVIVPNTVPCDIVEIKIIKLEASRAIGKLLTLVQPSPSRVEPVCSVANQCGGCQLQHVEYEAQIGHKSTLLSSAIGGAPSVSPCLTPLHYRNKLQMTFSRDRDGIAQLGLYASHSNRVVDTEHCHIVHPDIQDMLSDIRSWMQKQEELPQHVVIRHSRSTGDMMAIFVLLPSQMHLQDILLRSFSHTPRCTSLWININDAPESSVLSESFQHLSGTTSLSDSLLGCHFTLSPDCFTQNNPDMAEVLYTHIQTILRDLSVDTVWDLYCGIGVLTQICASEVKHITGIEVVPSAVEHAKASAEKNALSNCNFVCDDAAQFVVNSLGTQTPDAVIVDPPRKGCSPELLEALGHKKIAHIVYVSCSPQSLKRDLKTLSNMGYTITSSLGFDCFPNTVHVESVTLLTYAL